MNPRVRQRVDHEDGEDISRSGVRQRVDHVAPNVQESPDWTTMESDPMLHIFTLLDNRDRASLASTCPAWRSLGASPHLWSSLDLRAHRFDLSAAASLADRCGDLQKLRFDSLDSPAALVNLKAKNLREISGERCETITDITLSMIVARHEDLESLELGPGFGERITSEALKTIAICCPKLTTLRVSRMRNVSSDAILSLAENCPQLYDLGFLDCVNINEEALGQVVSLRYLAVTGTSNINWRVAAERWGKLPNLTGLDVSRTSIDDAAVSRLCQSSQNLEVVCSLNCPILEQGDSFALFEDNRRLTEDTMRWFDWNISRTLLFMAENSLLEPEDCSQSEVAKLFLNLMESTQEDVQERGATGLAAFLQDKDDDDEDSVLHTERAEAVMRDGGVPILLKLAESWKESFQSEAAKAIANLCLNSDGAKAVTEAGGVDVLIGLAKSKNILVAPEAAKAIANLCLNADGAKAVAEAGGVDVLLGLAKSMNILVAQEGAGAVWNLSHGDAYKAIIQAGGVNVLMELLSRWPHDNGRLMECAAGALANLAGEDECSMEIARAGGVPALVMLARNCEHEGAKAQAARCLANLATQDDESNSNNAAIGQEPGALETLLQMTRSHHDGIKQEAAGALWSLLDDDKNRESIVALGGVEALVELAQSCFTKSRDVQENAAGALWALAQSKEQSIAIGNQGGIPPLLALARFYIDDVHDSVTGALWNLSFNHANALRIVEEGGVTRLGHMCTSSSCQLARFQASLTLANIFDGRSKNGCSAKVRTNALKCIESFIKTFADPKITARAASSTTPSRFAQVLEELRIQEADTLSCTGEEIDRIVAMLRNRSHVLEKLAYFALLQFTIPGASHAEHHASLIKNSRDVRNLLCAAAATGKSHNANIAKIVLRNLEHYQPE